MSDFRAPGATLAYPRQLTMPASLAWPQLALATFCTAGSTAIFLIAERVWTGRPLPRSPGFLARALTLNALQLALTLGTRKVWLSLFRGLSLLHLGALQMPWAEGFSAWFVSTFVYYWWHRLRHAPGFWRVFHQVHHSPARIEVLTSFYKHPLEMLADILISGTLAYGVLGISLQGAFWLNFFAATAEYFYHANFKSPRWLRYFIQTPELHAVHHQLDVHRYNFADLPLWDRLFGTYRDATFFAEACGFPRHNERKLMEMLRFRDVYEDGGEPAPLPLTRGTGGR